MFSLRRNSILFDCSCSLQIEEAVLMFLSGWLKSLQTRTRWRATNRRSCDSFTPLVQPEQLENRTLLAADLIAYAISVSDTTVEPGQRVTVNWTAKNQGTSATGFFPFGTSQQGVMWSTNSFISTSDDLLAREFLGWMGAGRTSPEAHRITIPSDATPGTSYWI
jgi:hypothetical protein